MTSRGYAPYRRPRGRLARLRWRWRLWHGRHRHPEPPSLVDGRDYTGWTVRLREQVEHAMLPPIGTVGAVTRCERSGRERFHQIEFPDGGGGVAIGLPSTMFELIPPPPTPPSLPPRR